jgi:DNA topoisomerase-1
MSKTLVIVESPAKAKTINRILGKDFLVTSSVGHVRDLPERSLGVDLENNFEPKYVVPKSKQKLITQLKKDAKGCDTIVLAPDPDREGEAIAWHIEEILREHFPDKVYQRVQYNEITPRAVKAAFEEPGSINMKRVDAQQARRVLDRIVGYKVSPMLWRRLQRGLSAGRVQSVALRLVCERDAEIEKFVPEPYWIMGATVRKVVVPLDPFKIKLVRIDDEKLNINSEEDAKAVLDDLGARKLAVKEILTKDVTRRAPPPFITSTLQQAGSTHSGFTPQRTMSLAQKLYEGVDFGEGPVGLITYMRTDSFSISKDAQDDCAAYITKKFGKDFVPAKPNVYRSRSGAQEAHEAIRPTDVNRTPEMLKGKVDAPELKLYRIIWQRFIASQMAPAVLIQRTARIEAVKEADADRSYLFQATSSDIKFAGYMRVTGAEEARKKEPPKGGEKDGEEELQNLPKLSEGEPLICLEWLSDRKETKPPPRFSQASLIRELESNGVGRPSTYAATISTLQQRTYVDADRRNLQSTALGRRVNDLLVETLNELFDVKFTAMMETALDEIEEGNVAWTDMLADFYAKFEKWMEGTKLPPADTAAVNAALGLFEPVTEWAPEVKRGKRTYSDEKFVISVKKQLDDAEKPISTRQLETLVKMACRYRTQIPALETVLGEIGLADFLKQPDAQPPLESSIRKLEIAAGLGMDEKAGEFVASLTRWVQGGRRLTPAQMRALDQMLIAHSDAIPGFEAMKGDLNIGDDAPEKDEESPILLGAMGSVKEWKEAVKRGKRTFDDKEFHDSLSQQFGSKGYLSDRQRAALKRMVKRYRDQIPNYEEVAEKCEIPKSKEKAPKEDTAEKAEPEAKSEDA